MLFKTILRMCPMKKIPNGKYSKEFRIESAKLVIEEGLGILEAARRLNGLSHSLLMSVVCEGLNFSVTYSVTQKFGTPSALNRMGYRSPLSNIKSSTCDI